MSEKCFGLKEKNENKKEKCIVGTYRIKIKVCLMMVRTCRSVDTVPFNCCRQVILTNNIACIDIICLKFNKSEKHKDCHCFHWL